MNIAGTQRAAFQIAELVEHQQWMMAGAGVIAVPHAIILLAARWPRSNPCRARCPSVDDDHGRYRSTGRTSRKGQRSLQVPRAIASRASNLARRSCAALSRLGADNPSNRRIVTQPLGVVHVLIPHIQRSDQTPTA